MPMLLFSEEGLPETNVESRRRTIHDRIAIVSHFVSLARPVKLEVF